jgi:hypothetical protein
MTGGTLAREAASPAGPPTSKGNYITADYGWKSWLLTTDHKRIALLYLISITFFFFVGGAFAVLMRLELITPGGDVVKAETYNKLFTMHGVIMVFFFLIPSIPATLGNFLIPMMIGARDLAFPRLNLASWYIYVIGGLFTLFAVVSGGVDTGWTFYTPYSSTYANTHVIATALGIFITGFSSILTGLNFVVTVHKMRAPGMTWFRLPLFVWAHYATALIQLLGTPVLAVTILLVGLERLFAIGIFDPALGGDPILFQHLFWFYSHPAVYIMILPGMGVLSELVTCFARKRIFGYHFIAFSSLAIAVFGFLVWGHHMFVSGQSAYAGMVFSFLSMVVAIPSAIKVFNWTATLYKGSISLDTPMLYALGFIGLFTIGGLTGLFLATLAVDVHVQAFRLAEELSIPVMVCMDGFILTHAYTRIDMPEQSQVDAFLPPFQPRQVLDPSAPLSIGAMVGPDAFTEVRYLAHHHQLEALDLIPEQAAQFQQLFGRDSGGLVKSFGAQGAETVVVTMGSVIVTMKPVLEDMRRDGHSIGALTIRSFRPFPREALREALAGARRVIVVEKSLAVGMGGILGADVRMALNDRPVRVGSAVAGLGGRPSPAKTCGACSRRPSRTRSKSPTSTTSAWTW